VSETPNNHPLGALIARTEDDQGVVCIRQLGQHRFLTFGNAVEQSCFNISQPYRLEHVYTQAMMLGLLLQPASHSALVLGLGGGSLVRALRHALPPLDITAIESRQSVLHMAQHWFGIEPGDPALTLVCQDAAEFLELNTNTYDLILADLYLSEGVNPLQNTRDFIEGCKKHLNAHGILILNHWCSEFRDSQVAREALQKAFGQQILQLHVQGGNVLSYALNGPLPNLQRKALLESALLLGRALDIPLHKLARNFWRQNSEPLKLGRFRRQTGC